MVATHISKKSRPFPIRARSTHLSRRAVRAVPFLLLALAMLAGALGLPAHAGTGQDAVGNDAGSSDGQDGTDSPDGSDGQPEDTSEEQTEDGPDRSSVGPGMDAGDAPVDAPATPDVPGPEPGDEDPADGAPADPADEENERPSEDREGRPYERGDDAPGVIPVPPGVPQEPVRELWEQAPVGPVAPEGRLGDPADPAASAASGPAPDPGPARHEVQADQAEERSRAEVIAVWAPVAAGAGAGLVGLSALLSRYGAALLLALHLLAQRAGVLLGYRLEGETVREHPIRATIMDHVGKHPGSTLAEVTRATDGSYGACTHHLRMLLRAGFLRSRVVDGTRRYFLASTPKVADGIVRARGVANPEKTSGKVLAHLAEHNGQPTSHAAYALGISLGQVAFHLGNLRRHGLVRSVRKGRRVRNYVTELGRLALEAAHNGLSEEHYQVEAATLALRTPRLAIPDEGSAVGPA